MDELEQAVADMRRMADTLIDVKTEWVEGWRKLIEIREIERKLSQLRLRCWELYQAQIEAIQSNLEVGPIPIGQENE